ncbi:MAG: hypothetical protein AAF718_00050 [Pseudomonadota bacterium]
MRLNSTVAASLFILSACGSEAPDDRQEVSTASTVEQALPGPSEAGGSGALAEVELCDAKDYRVLVGSDVDDTSFPLGPRLRVFGINDIVTQDYIPQRTNVVYSDKRRILRIYCG